MQMTKARLTLDFPVSLVTITDDTGKSADWVAHFTNHLTKLSHSTLMLFTDPDVLRAALAMWAKVPGHKAVARQVSRMELYRILLGLEAVGASVCVDQDFGHLFAASQLRRDNPA